jgi:hypothetical protein
MDVKKEHPPDFTNKYIGEILKFQYVIRLYLVFRVVNELFMNHPEQD